MLDSGQGTAFARVVFLSQGGHLEWKTLSDDHVHRSGTCSSQVQQVGFRVKEISSSLVSE